MNMRNPASILALAALLCSCAAPKTAVVWRPEPLPSPTPVQILIETSPAGGVVDWNGDVLGVAPVTLTITPQLTNYGRPRWPETGASAHIFRARWPDGSRAAELFIPNEIPPQRIAIISPNYARDVGLRNALSFLENKYGTPNLRQKNGP